MSSKTTKQYLQSTTLTDRERRDLEKRMEKEGVQRPGLTQGPSSSTSTPARKTYPNRSASGQTSRYQAEQTATRRSQNLSGNSQSSRYQAEQAAARRAQQYDNAFGKKTTKTQTRGQISSVPTGGAARVTAINGKKVEYPVAKVTAVKKATPKHQKNTGETGVGVVSVKKTKKKGR